MAGVTTDEWSTWTRKKREEFSLAMSRSELNEGTKRLLAQRYGAHPGHHILIVKCDTCDRTGEIHWCARIPRFASLHIDHIRPVSRGGGNELENLRLLCPTCNIRRGNREDR